MALEFKMAQLGDRVGGDPGRTEAVLELAARVWRLAGRLRPVSEPVPAAGVVLFRCPTPTDYLCPCGAVSRRPRKLGVEFGTVRVPLRAPGWAAEPRSRSSPVSPGCPC